MEETAAQGTLVQRTHRQGAKTQKKSFAPAFAMPSIGAFRPGQHRPPELNAPAQKSPTKKPPSRVAFRCRLIATIKPAREQMFYLASSYFCRGLPPNYRRRCCVSQPSSRWIGVGPQRHGHQDRNQPKPYGIGWFRFCPQVNPENCIGNGLSLPVVNSTSRLAFAVWKSSDVEPSVGQALGLLVLLRFTHYCAST